MTRWRDPDFSNPVTMPRVTQGESARESDGADLAVITGWHDCQFATLVGGPFSKTCYVRSDLGPTRTSGNATVTGAQGIDDLQAREVFLGPRHSPSRARTGQSAVRHFLEGDFAGAWGRKATELWRIYA